MSRACWDTKVRLQKVQLRGPVTMPCDDLRENMFRVSFVACPAHESSGKKGHAGTFSHAVAESPAAATPAPCFGVSSSSTACVARLSAWRCDAAELRSSKVKTVAFSTSDAAAGVVLFSSAWADPLLSAEDVGATSVCISFARTQARGPWLFLAAASEEKSKKARARAFAEVTFSSLASRAPPSHPPPTRLQLNSSDRRDDHGGSRHSASYLGWALCSANSPSSNKRHHHHLDQQKC